MKKKINTRATLHMHTNVLHAEIKNVQYHASKVEESIDVVANEKNEEVVAVFDPPRSGVHSSVIRAVRESPQIRKVIFISCDARQAMDNFVKCVFFSLKVCITISHPFSHPCFSLCRPTSNRFQGAPFQPTRAVTVDLFPHTWHSELMVEFVRVDQK